MSGITHGESVSTETVQWLTWMFGAEPPGALWVGGHADLWHGQTFAGGQAIENAAEYAGWLETASVGTQGGVYFRLTPMRMRALDSAHSGDGGQGRGKAADSTHLVAFGADLDLDGPGHKDAKLPRPKTHEQLVEILKGAGLPEPSAWVHSGGGRYAFWRMAGAIRLDPDGSEGDITLARATAASSALHARIIAEAARLGFKIDNTRDLARVYRLPGTLNRKGAEPFCAHVLSTDGPLYTLAAIETAVLNSPELDLNSPEPAAARERIEVPSSSSSAPRSSLFGDPAPGPRRLSVAYTLADAMRFVAPAIGRLRAAREGEINNRLTDASITLAHFGPEFWSREAAEKQLYAALEATIYDAATWQAPETIESAYAAMAARGEAGDPDYWAARLIPTAAQAAAAGNAVDALRAKLLDRDALEAMPEPEPLIVGLLDMDSESWCIGPSGDFKSFVALDISCHVATGLTWRTRATKRGDVIYIAAEGAKGIRKRIQAWERTYKKRADGVYVLPMPVQVASGVKSDPISADWHVLAALIGQMKPALVVIDTQARVTAGMNENDNGEMGVFVQAVTMLKEAARSCVLVVHHTGRNGGDARGASAIDAAQDTELKVERPKNKAKRAELTFKIHLDKQKDDADGSFIEAKMTTVTLGTSVHTGKPLTSLAILSHDAWAPAAASPGQPDWRRDLSGVSLEVMTVMTDHAEEDGALQTQITTWINERRKELDEKAKPVPKSTVSTAVGHLCGKPVEGYPVIRQVLQKVGRRYSLIEFDKDPDVE